MHDYLQVTTTTETKDDAARIAALLVERRLAACVQVTGPITSTFRWEGKIQSAEEWHCIAKTRRDLYRACRSRDSRVAPLPGARNHGHGRSRRQPQVPGLA